MPSRKLSCVVLGLLFLSFSACNPDGNMADRNGHEPACAQDDAFFSFCEAPFEDQPVPVESAPRISNQSITNVHVRALNDPCCATGLLSSLTPSRKCERANPLDSDSKEFVALGLTAGGCVCPPGACSCG